MKVRPMYGIGYQPMGDLLDLVDPFGIRKVPGKVKSALDRDVEAKTQRAASVTGARVKDGVHQAVDGAERKAVVFLMGGLVGASVVASALLVSRLLKTPGPESAR